MTGRFKINKVHHMWEVNYVSDGRVSYIVRTQEHEDALRVIAGVLRGWGHRG